MAVQKKNSSKSSQGMRRSLLSLSVPAYVECTQCHEMTRPHHICAHCGYYKGKEVMEVEAV